MPSLFRSLCSFGARGDVNALVSWFEDAVRHFSVAETYAEYQKSRNELNELYDNPHRSQVETTDRIFLLEEFEVVKRQLLTAISNAVSEYEKTKLDLFSSPSRASILLRMELSQFTCAEKIKKTVVKKILYYMSNSDNEKRSLYFFLNKWNCFYLCKKYIAHWDFHHALNKVEKSELTPSEKSIDGAPSFEEPVTRDTYEFDELVKKIKEQYSPSFTSSKSSENLYFILNSERVQRSKKAGALLTYMKDQVRNQRKKLFNVIVGALNDIKNKPVLSP
jgi:hypothetical protein